MKTALVLTVALLSPQAHGSAPAAGPPRTAASESWTQFTPTAGRFTVSLPGTPTAKTSTQRTAAGLAKIDQYEVVDATGAHLAVVVAEFPAGTARNRLPQQVLDGARDGALANVRGRATEDFEVFLPAPAGKGGAIPGRQIVAEAPPDMVMRERIFLVDDTLITLMFVQRKAADSPRTFLKMAESFRLSR